MNYMKQNMFSNINIPSIDFKIIKSIISI